MFKKKGTRYCYLKSIVQVPLSIIYLFSLFFLNGHITLSKRIIIAVIINKFFNRSLLSFIIKKKAFHC